MSEEVQAPEQNQAPKFDESKIQEMVEQRAAEIASEKYRDYQSPQEVQGLIKKRDELLEKTARFKDLSVEDIEQLRLDKERKAQDEVYRLMSEGKHDEALNKVFEPQKMAWQEKLTGTEEQLASAQETLEKERQEKLALSERLTEIQKRTYLKDLIGEDASFRKEYFSEFYELYKGKIEFDPDTGAVYALNNGKRRVDADGNHIKFEAQYSRDRAENGLFWKGGQGTNTRGSNGVSEKPFNKMTGAEKTELRKSIGEKAFMDLVRNANKK